MELDPKATTITFTLEATLHSVHGSFALNRGTIHFNPATGSAGGLVVVDLASGETGNQGRNHKMHKDVLESERYPEATFAPTKISGAFSGQGESKVQMDGVFKLQGTEHAMSVAVLVKVSGHRLTGQVQLSIPYVEWGLKNPSTLFLHVGHTVAVEIDAAGELTGQ